jgi:methyltransferase
MVTSHFAYAAVLSCIALERAWELFLSRRNARLALEQGGVEVGQRHFRWMVVLHTLIFPVSLAEVLLMERPFHPWLAGAMGAGLVVSMGLRYWAVSTLGPAWNTRVLVVPGRAVVDTGPYRWIRHPNYVAVCMEMLTLPLLHGAWMTAGVFSLGNAALLKVRIRVEEAALTEHCGYGERMGQRPRFVPESP